MRIITQRDVIKGVPEKFRSQYGHFLDTPAFWKPGSTKGAIADALDALDTERCSTADVDEVIGVGHWAANKCDECGAENCETLVRLGEEPDYEARWLDLCAGCLTAALEAVRGKVRTAEQERADVLAWLRWKEAEWDEKATALFGITKDEQRARELFGGCAALLLTIEAIERGDHTPPPPATILEGDA